MTASVARTRTMVVGGQTVTNAAVMTIGDQILDAIQGEVKHPVDGLLGGNYLREFLVTVDYPHGTMRLQRYDTPPVADEFKRIGIELGAGSGSHRFVVGVVYEGTDAQMKQLRVGDELICHRRSTTGWAGFAGGRCAALGAGRHHTPGPAGNRLRAGSVRHHDRRGGGGSRPAASTGALTTCPRR